MFRWDSWRSPNLWLLQNRWKFTTEVWQSWLVPIYICYNFSMQFNIVNWKLFKKCWSTLIMFFKIKSNLNFFMFCSVIFGIVDSSTKLFLKMCRGNQTDIIVNSLIFLMNNKYNIYQKSDTDVGTSHYNLQEWPNWEKTKYILEARKLTNHFRMCM